MNEFKLVPMEPTEAMIDAARDQHEGEPYLPVSLYKAMLAAAPAVQGEPVAFCEDGALALAEDTFSTEVDEQLAVDVIKFARRLHSKWATSQPTPDVSALVEALEATCDYLPIGSQALEKVRAALAAHRKQEDFNEPKPFA